jgi:hypothetical protein
MARGEVETVITWTADDDKATVYSLMPKVWRWCERAGGEEIRLDDGICDGKTVARTFLVPVECVRVRKKRPKLSAEAAEASRTRLQALRGRLVGPTAAA